MWVGGLLRSPCDLLSASRPVQTQMDQVGTSLVALHAGLLGVEKEMLPIYTLTEKLRATQKNIDLCVHELQHINKNFIAAQEVRRSGLCVLYLHCSFF